MSKKNRKKRHPTRSADREWAESVVKRTGGTLLDMPLPEGKVSDIVAEFAQPLVEESVESEQDYADILTIACTLWNMAIMKEADMDGTAELEAMAMRVLSGAPFFLRPDQTLNLLEFMLKRWQRDFSWCRRIILDRHIVIEKNGVHISIVSTPIVDHTSR